MIIRVLIAVIWIGVLSPNANRAEGDPLKPTTAEYSEDDLEVLELVLRRVLSSAREESLCFLSFGTLGKTWISAPQSFVDRFSDLPLRFKLVSDARIPSGVEKNPNRILHSIEDRSTSETGKIYYARIIGWHGKHKVEVAAGVYGGRLDACGARYILEKQNDKWVVSMETHRWVS